MAGAVAAGQDIDPSLRSFAAEEIASGVVLYFAPYEEVHAGNIAAVKAALQR